jgi:hypothetical protein
MADREEKIRRRAYAIWFDEGCADGRDKEHWLEAEKEIQKEEAAGEPVVPTSKAPQPPAISDEAALPEIPNGAADEYNGSAM